MSRQPRSCSCILENCLRFLESWGYWEKCPKKFARVNRTSSWQSTICYVCTMMMHSFVSLDFITSPASFLLQSIKKYYFLFHLSHHICALSHLHQSPSLRFRLIRHPHVSLHPLLSPSLKQQHIILYTDTIIWRRQNMKCGKVVSGSDSQNVRNIVKFFVANKMIVKKILQICKLKNLFKSATGMATYNSSLVFCTWLKAGAVNILRGF